MHLSCSWATFLWYGFHQQSRRFNWEFFHQVSINLGDIISFRHGMFACMCAEKKRPAIEWNIVIKRASYGINVKKWSCDHKKVFGLAHTVCFNFLHLRFARR